MLLEVCTGRTPRAANLARVHARFPDAAVML